MDFLIYGNIPNGSGLSSSASLEVLTGLMLKDMFGVAELSMQDLALIGQYSENNFNGMNVVLWISLQAPWAKKTARSSLIQALWNLNMLRYS